MWLQPRAPHVSPHNASVPSEDWQRRFVRSYVRSFVLSLSIARSRLMRLIVLSSVVKRCSLLPSHQCSLQPPLLVPLLEYVFDVSLAPCHFSHLVVRARLAGTMDPSAFPVSPIEKVASPAGAAAAAVSSQLCLVIGMAFEFVRFIRLSIHSALTIPPLQQVCLLLSRIVYLILYLFFALFSKICTCRSHSCPYAESKPEKITTSSTFDHAEH